MHKRSYHPMLIVLFHLQLLDNELLKKIPPSTKTYWKQTIQNDQFGYVAVAEYMQKHDDIRSVYKSKLLFKFMRFSCRVYDGFMQIKSLLANTKQTKREVQKITIGTFSLLAQKTSVALASRVMGFSKQTYYRLRAQMVCRVSKIKRCFRSLPQQLSMREVQTIDKAMNDPVNFHKTRTTIFYTLLNEGKLACSLSTFYQYSRDSFKKLIKPKPVREALVAEYLFQYLHVDITELICTSGKVLIAFVKENKSKAIIGAKVLPDKSSVHIRDLFAGVFEEFKLQDFPERISIVSDGGSENKGELLLWIAQQVLPEVKKLTSGIEVRSNSHSETLHHIFKAEFLRYQPPSDAHVAVEKFVQYYNHERYMVDHFGYTCWEVLCGAVPDKNRFAAQKAEARLMRLAENRTFKCLQKVGCGKD
ncbi:MAG: hypothetical protein ACRCYO_10980 [Bacteroidia bacterium]